MVYTKATPDFWGEKKQRFAYPRFSEGKEAAVRRYVNRAAIVIVACRATPEGQEANRALVQRVNMAKKEYNQEWDYERPCPNCKCIWLKSDLLYTIYTKLNQGFH